MKTKTEADYRAAVKKIEKLNIKAYLVDENIDRENVLVDGVTESDPLFWTYMYNAARDAAFGRADMVSYKLLAKVEDIFK